MVYLNFVAGVDMTDQRAFYKIFNDKQERIGTLRKTRVGQWMSWCLFLEKDCYVSASCLDEIREKIKSLNNKKKVLK